MTFKHLKACLGPAFVTVFDQRGPPLAEETPLGDPKPSEELEVSR